MLFTQPLDTQTHGLTRTQKDRMGFDSQPHAWWRPSRNNVTGLQAHAAAQVGNQLRHIEDQSPRITFLIAVSVDFQPQVQRVRISDFILSDQPWADRTERIEAFAFVPNAGPAASLQR